MARCLIALFLGLVAATRGSSAVADKWEYAEVYFASDRYSWNYGTVHIEAKSIEELSKLMAAKKIIPRPVDRFYSLLNELGDLGWELIIVDRSIGVSYQLKRRKA